MNDLGTMFARIWVTAVGELWNCQGTYCGVPYEDLPRLIQVTDDFRWLDSVSPELRRVIAATSTLNSSENQIQNLEDLAAKAKRLALELPESFLRFMGEPLLQGKVPTCTACFLALSGDLLPIPGAERRF